MKKNVIGIRTEYMLPGLAAGAVALVAAFLPYVTQEGASFSLLNLALAGGSMFTLAAMVFSVLAVVLGVVNFLSPSVRNVRLWVAAAIVPTVSYAILLFSRKGWTPRACLPSPSW